MYDYRRFYPITEDILPVVLAHHIRIRIPSFYRVGNFYNDYALSISEDSANIIEALNGGRVTTRILNDMGLRESTDEVEIRRFIVERRIKRVYVNKYD